LSQSFASRASSVDSRFWRLLAWSGVALELAALVVVLMLERWGGAWSIAAFLILSVGFLLSQDRTPGPIDVLVIVAAMVNAAGWAWDLFDRFVWYDETVHFFMTFAVIAALGICYGGTRCGSARRTQQAWFCASAALVSALALHGRSWR
jgi:hypothetical protein